MQTTQFHPAIDEWFHSRFGEPTDAQRQGWPHIQAGCNVLLAAPTGSGKTLAAFLSCIDRMLRLAIEGTLPEKIQTVYVSPLRALSNDMRRNLELPLSQIQQIAQEHGTLPTTIRTAVRTGDTPQSKRAAMLRKPPHILVTTPESLYLMLTGARSRELLSDVNTVIVDEIHALARDKRGTHLAVSLQRLDALCSDRPQRIGLSATQRPIEKIADFLVGPAGRECQIVDIGHQRQIDLAIDVPPEELGAVCSAELWQQIYQRLARLISEHRSTLIFVNTRRLAERVTHQLSEMIGEEAVASHHGSLSQRIRHRTETLLKSGQLKAVVATASLELGIDVGHIDLVCQIASPRCIATLLQRIGRSGHALRAVPKGRLFPLTRDELLECLALLRATRNGRLDQIEIPDAPLDILAQQVVAMVSCEPWHVDELYQAFRNAYPYRNLKRSEFDAVIDILAEGVSRQEGRTQRFLHFDRINGQLRDRRGARLTAITCGGAIPETADYRVVTEGDQTYVGTVDEDFAIESMAGDIFLLGNTSWRIRHVRGGQVTVVDAGGAPPTIPFWRGEAPGRTAELSAEVSQLRQAIVAHLDDHDEAVGWLMNEVSTPKWAAQQAIRYVRAQNKALGLVPSQQQVVFERFFDEAGGMQLVVHAPFGSRINRAWGLALRKRFCRSFNFELQASADDDGIVLSLGPQHSFPLEQMFGMVRPQTVNDLLEQAVLATPMFQLRWRWNATRALAVLRQRGGKRVPPFLQRMRSDNLLSAVFPEQTACLEHVVGDIEIPDHPLVNQTMHDCMHEAMDLDGLMEVLNRVEEDGDVPPKPEGSLSDDRSLLPDRVRLVGRDTREPSPFAYELLNANPYAFLDDAPLEERRARAVATRRSLPVESLADLAKLDPEAIQRVREQAWPTARDSDELHDALSILGAVPANYLEEWAPLFEQLLEQGRATQLRRPNDVPTLWLAAEFSPMIRAVVADGGLDPVVTLPSHLNKEYDRTTAMTTIVRGWMECLGPTTARTIAATLGLDAKDIHRALEKLESEGAVLRGSFTALAPSLNEVEWCDRRLLSRIHRYTREGLRRQIEPVTPEVFQRFLLHHQHVHPETQFSGKSGLSAVVAQLQGFAVPALLWESEVLPCRMTEYRGQWLDDLMLIGQLGWARLGQPIAKDESTSFLSFSRVVPISLFVRDDTDWLLGNDLRNGHRTRELSSRAQLVLDVLNRRGALFFTDLLKQTGLLAAEADQVLGELLTAGLVTSDCFAVLRSLMSTPSNRHPARRGPHRRSKANAAGRWAALIMTDNIGDEDCDTARAKESASIEQWCELLLQRYGVIFRDLLARESNAPQWRQLLRTYRRMEMRGKVRGGRFVADVAGEQYALPEAVTQLRRLRDAPPDNELKVISACDPLNLSGIITADRRIPATAHNLVAFYNGTVAGYRQGEQVQISEMLPPEAAEQLQEMLTRKQSTTALSLARRVGQVSNLPVRTTRVIPD